MRTGVMYWMATTTSIAFLAGCGGAQESRGYDMAEAHSSAPPSSRPVAVEAGGYGFDDDVVASDLVRPHGEMALGSSATGAESGPAPASTPAPAPSTASAPSRDSAPAAAASTPPAASTPARAAARPIVDEAERGPRATASGAAIDTSISLDGDVLVAPSAPVHRPMPVVARLTAASVGDVDRRGPYLEYLSRHPAEAAQIGLDMSRRVRFRVLDAASRPIHDAQISLSVGGRQVSGRTHADGYWDFFPGVSAPASQGPSQVTVTWRGQRGTETVQVPAAGDGRDVVIQLPQAAAVAPASLDLAFLIDVTGSMGDELAYITHELTGIVQQVRAASPQINIRLAAVFYRDRGDMRPLEHIGFTSDVGAFVALMSRVSAGGGGDYPEDLNIGFEAALERLAWSQGPAARVLVTISDAPPQQYPDAQYTYHHAMQSASARGVRILPVAASGADRVVEYLFRAMGAFTSTPYVYLTDDSGIGGHHMEADTDRISVEMFSNLLTRLLIADLQGQGMHEPSHADQGQGMVLGLAR